MIYAIFVGLIILAIANLIASVNMSYEDKLELKARACNTLGPLDEDEDCPYCRQPLINDECLYCEQY